MLPRTNEFPAWGDHCEEEGRKQTWIQCGITLSTPFKWLLFTYLGCAIQRTSLWPVTCNNNILIQSSSKNVGSDPQKTQRCNIYTDGIYPKALMVSIHTTQFTVQHTGILSLSITTIGSTRLN